MATFVAIMQNASCGVRTWMACQLRFSTSTIVLFRMSLMKVLAHATALRAMRCLSFVEMQFKSSIGNHQSEMKVAASPGFAPGCLRTATIRFQRAGLRAPRFGAPSPRTPDYATRPAYAHGAAARQALACRAVARRAKAGRPGRFCPSDFWV